MGLSRSVHVGPMVICQKTALEVPKKVYFCKDGCPKKFYTGKFCDTCGNPVVERQIVVVQYMPDDWDSIYLQMSQKLYIALNLDDEAQDVWLANVNWSKRDCSIDQYETVVEVIQSFTREEELKKFNSFFKNQIEMLNNHYGEKNVKVEWGIFAHTT